MNPTTHKTSPTGDACFLRDFFTAIRDRQLGYAVLRDYESLPDSTGGHDLDIIVLPGDLESMAQLVAEMAEKYAGVVTVDYTGSGRFMRILGNYEDAWWGVAIDLFPRMEYKGVEYIGAERLIDRSSDYRGISVLNDDDAVVLRLIKEILANGKTRKNYLPQAALVWREKGVNCLELIRERMSENTKARMTSLLESGKEEELGVVAEMLREDVLRSGGWTEKVINVWLRLRRLVKTPGISIAVLGTDGAGKTTIIDGVRPVLEEMMHAGLVYEHLRPNWIPSLAGVTGKKPLIGSGVVDRPHEKKPSGFLGSLLRLAYYSIDYYLGYWVSIHPKLAKSPMVCVFDRYFYDFITDPKRMRMSLPRWIIELTLKFAPQPHLILCLGADPHVIYARKPETSLEEVSRQVDELRALCEANNRAVWIDTGKSVKDSCDAVLRAIMKFAEYR